MGKITSFTDLLAWQQSHKLVIMIYQTTKKFPKEKIQFYYLAQGSLTELKNQLIIARDIGYLNENNFLLLSDQADQAHKLLQGLITKSKTFLKS